MNNTSQFSSYPLSWSRPYHQNQSLPSAIYKLSQAASSPGWSGLSASKDTNALRASIKRCQPRLSSASPAQVESVPSTQEPVPMVSIRGRSLCVSRNSPGVVVTIVGCVSSRENHSWTNGRPLSLCWNSDINIQFSPSIETVSKCSEGSSPASSNCCLTSSIYDTKSVTASSGVIEP